MASYRKLSKALQLEMPFGPEKKIDLPYYDNPKNLKEKYMNYQKDFIEKNDVSAWNEMWTISLSIAKKIISKEVKKKGFFLDKSDMEDKAYSAVEYVLRRYKTRQNYYVKKSIVAVIRGGVVHALYYRTTIDKLTDYFSEEDMINMTRSER